jgi:hypothetical protein
MDRPGPDIPDFGHPEPGDGPWRTLGVLVGVIAGALAALAAWKYWK